MNSIQERVARGVAWLDDVRPGWRDAVSPERVFLASGTDCILGQVFADEGKDGYGFAPGVRLLVEARLPEGFEHRLSAYGFASGCSKETCAEIIVEQMRLVEAEWRRVIHAPQPARVPA